MPAPPAPARLGVAFLLTQLGTHAADRFALALAEHDLTPPLAGILRMLRAEPDLSQQQLAERLGTAPSRIVAYLDDLEARGWVSRTRGTDRRRNVLALTPAGRSALAALGTVAVEHERVITAPLSEQERITLLDLLGRLADGAGLAPGVHPGYRAG